MNPTQKKIFHLFERLFHMLGGQNTKWTKQIEKEIQTLRDDIRDNGKSKTFILNPKNLQEAIDLWRDNKKIKHVILEQICFDMFRSFLDISNNPDVTILQRDWYQLAKLPEDYFVAGRMTVHQKEQEKEEGEEEIKYSYSLQITFPSKKAAIEGMDLLHNQNSFQGPYRIALVDENRIQSK